MQIGKPEEVTTLKHVPQDGVHVEVKKQDPKVEELIDSMRSHLWMAAAADKTDEWDNRKTEKSKVSF